MTDAAGRPVGDANVSVVQSSVPFPEMALLTDEHGVVQLFLPEGRFTFEAHGPDQVSGRVRLVSDGNSPTRAEIVVT